MAKSKAVSDEQITAALLANGTLKEAAAAVGISERALYDRINSGDFQAVYKAAKADLMRGAVLRINRHVQAAIDTVARILQDDSNNAAVRLQAAQTILNNAGKFAQRLQADEDRTEAQIAANRLDMW